MLLLFGRQFTAQGFQISHPKKTIIPFQLINNLIFIPLTVNGVDLTFLLDSGVNETLLFSLENKEVDFKNIKKVTFSGLGETKTIEGLQSDQNVITIGKGFKDEGQTIFIILDESINLSAHVGIPVNGIIGYQFFRNHPVLIDFLSKRITVYNDLDLMKRKTRNFQEFPITLENNKPYMFADVEMRNEPVSSKMLIDLGNSDALWLFPKLIENFTYNRPNIDDYLGQGFNGDIYGKRSRIHRVRIGDFVLEKPLIAMPDEYSIQNLKIVPGRKGSVGNDVLRRFSLLIDYPDRKIYLKKNRNFNQPFVFNKSGLDVQHDGMLWEKDLVPVQTAPVRTEREGIQVYDAEKQNFRYNFILKPQYSVAGCRKGSPCEEAGIQKNDKILKINGRAAGNFTLQKILDLLRGDDGESISFEIERNGEKKTVNIQLKDPIPYEDAD